MSDFLTTLAARALEVGQFVTPRPSSLFEPQASDAGLAFEPAVVVQREPEPQMPVLKPSPLRPVVPPLEEPREDVRPRPEVGSRERMSTIAQAPQIPRSSPPSPLSPPAPTAPTAAGRPTVQTPDPVITRIVTVEETQELIPAVLRHESAEEDKPVRKPPAPDVPVRQVAPPLIAPPLSRPSAIAPTFPAPQRPEPPVTVEVTIGRVEVRAVQSPTPKPLPAPSRQGPALSLDEYLKRRNRGSR